MSLDSLQQSAENTKQFTLTVVAPTTKVSLPAWQDAQDYVGIHSHEDGSSSATYLLDENKNPVDFNSDQLMAYMEYANAISDSGHYVIYIETIQSSGEPFYIAFEATTSYDNHELNDVGGDAKPISALTEVIGNIDNFSDIDFFTYHTEASETK